MPPVSVSYSQFPQAGDVGEGIALDGIDGVVVQVKVL